MKKYFDVLRKCALFEYIEDENLFAILKCLGARLVSFKKGNLIMQEGDKANNIGLVLSGTVQMVRVDYYGNRSIVDLIEPSNVFGESFACADETYMPLDVIALEDCELLLIDCKRVVNSCTNACDFHRQLIFNLLKMVARKNVLYGQKMEITSQRTTREKLMTYLLQQAQKEGKNEFEIPYDRQELADFLEVDRSGLSAEISKMKRDNIIENKKNKFKIL